VTNYGGFPTHTAGLGADWTHDRLLISLQLYYMSAITQLLAPATATTAAQYASTNQRVIINPMVSYIVDPGRVASIYVAGTNVGNVRIGNGINQDYATGNFEQIGATVWAGIKLKI
jgi:hypothetical protein